MLLCGVLTKRAPPTMMTPNSLMANRIDGVASDVGKTPQERTEHAAAPLRPECFAINASSIKQ
jgi:hypothetical protein